MSSLPTVHQLFTANQTKYLAIAVEKVLLSQLPHKAEGAHHRNLSRLGKLGGVAILSPRSAKKFL